ncbi:MAG: hypothetical protein GOVbin3171_29 [Prokaryotic dsDNA virus sp.]|nr:MAG: hypothetical protein GOVbin3171_29 [Prokaryotic dsDNA virus sp.]|tara:strand:+ start:5937 stop:6392 length:456 start_codon:yes stop_codon:yes gene_type:complete
MRRYKKRRQITRSKKTKIDGIQFQSKLESHMYLLLKANKIKAGYESEKFTIIDSFFSNHSSYEKTPTKKYLHDRGNKKILPITYTPDFVDTQTPPRFIIECKGNPNERFPLVWKLFKRYINLKGWSTDLFVPRNQKDCQEVINVIKDKYYL